MCHADRPDTLHLAGENGLGIPGGTRVSEDTPQPEDSARASEFSLSLMPSLQKRAAQRAMAPSKRLVSSRRALGTAGVAP